MRLMLVVYIPAITLSHTSLPGPRPTLLRFLLSQEHFVIAEVTEVEVGPPGSPFTGRRRLAVLEDIQRFRPRLAVVTRMMTTTGLPYTLVSFVSLPLGDLTSPRFSW